MLVLKERILNVPVMSLQTGTEIARTSQPIIDPRNLFVVAFYCEGPMIDVKPAILHVEDIREVSNLGFIVDSSDVLMTPDDLVRLKSVIGFNFKLDGKLVVEQNGHKVGRVTDYTLDTKSFYITQLHVQPGLLQALASADIVISRNQIIEINDKQIVVASATIHDKVVEQGPRVLVENPFRTRPQAETIRTNDD